MKRSTSIITFIAIVAILLSFKKDNPPPKDHEYIIKGTLQQFVFMSNFLDKTNEVLKRTSSLPSNVLVPETDTLNQIRNFLLVQVQSQFSTFQKEDLKQDSIDKVKLKK